VGYRKIRIFEWEICASARTGWRCQRKAIFPGKTSNLTEEKASNAFSIHQSQ
jgi:hypothetical protein